MARTYRNALRSRGMIRKAFLELLSEKPLEKLTVVDIVERADLCRNTFYAHYQDVYAVLEELENEVLARMESALDEAVANKTFDNPLPFLLKMAEQGAENKQMLLLLMKGGNADALIGRMRAALRKRILANLDTVGVCDKKGLLAFIEVLTAGFVQLFRQYLHGETDMTAQEIAQQINRMFITGIKAYR